MKVKKYIVSFGYGIQDKEGSTFGHMDIKLIPGSSGTSGKITEYMYEDMKNRLIEELRDLIPGFEEDSLLIFGITPIYEQE